MKKPFSTTVLFSRARPRERYARSYTLPVLRQRLVAAEGQTHRTPSKAQREAGNYAKGLFHYRGLEISIENPAGSLRNGVDGAGKPWSNVLPFAYGYLRRTLARDGDQVDVFLGPDLDSDVVFGIDQINPKTGAYDETKWMLGWRSKQAAKQAYLDSYSPGWQGFLQITAMTWEQFRRWLEGGDQTKPIYKQVTERYARPWAQIKAEHLAKHPEQVNSGPNAWSEEDERKHPRNHGQFASKPGGQTSGAGGQQASTPSTAQPTPSTVSLGGRAFDIVKRGADWLFRIAKNAPWTKAAPEAASAIEKRLGIEHRYRQAASQFHQAAWGDVPEARRLHRRAERRSRSLVDRIVAAMLAGGDRPDEELDRREAAWRELLNRKYLPLARQTHAAYREAISRKRTAARLKDQLAKQLGRVDRKNEEIEDPETGELLPRHEVDRRQKQARQKARQELHGKRQQWQEDRRQAWQKQLADWSAKRQERENAREVSAARREIQAAKRKAEQEAKEKKQAAKNKLAAQMQAFYDANRKPHVSSQQQPRVDEEKREAAVVTAPEGAPQQTPNESPADDREPVTQAARVAAKYGVPEEHLLDDAKTLADVKGTEARQRNSLRKAARAQLGLDAGKARAWVNRHGKDPESWPAIDVFAPEMISQYPGVLAMGGSPDTSEVIHTVWDMIAQGDERVPQHYDPAILEEAARHLAPQYATQPRLPGEDEGEGEAVGAAAGGDASFPWEEFARNRGSRARQDAGELHR